MCPSVETLERVPRTFYLLKILKFQYVAHEDKLFHELIFLEHDTSQECQIFQASTKEIKQGSEQSKQKGRYLCITAKNIQKPKGLFSSWDLVLQSEFYQHAQQFSAANRDILKAEGDQSLQGKKPKLQSKISNYLRVCPFLLSLRKGQRSRTTPSFRKCLRLAITDLSGWLLCFLQTAACVTPQQERGPLSLSHR